ncbi:dihydroxyacetone kinase subunit DhaL [Marinactinospora thermotolerans]|uniref:Dihydroxyacetone kinase DhaL subunit n=1 Tax=Marinactinospora thermotolerans DSM 45154 TaxID=1122192 RepID=A0A1T4RTM5_9ACTN|nr:dihydroxyacetone kinase subunit DhaL [Marinactinospora thermotolerans]SKA19302.1 dihydroxyacetone kinase DhaL subunit [Marinactinospora thermotolerans DSM 45154]
MTTGFTPAQTSQWVDGFIATVERAEPELTDLDRRSGDGDFGTNMTTALRRTRDALVRNPPRDLGDPFETMSTTFLSYSGGTSGPLFGMWFREFAKAARGGEEFGVGELTEATANGLATIQRLGSAKVGDRTMVDAIAPAAEALERARSDGADLAGAVDAALEAAQRGAKGTSELLGRKGRSSYVGEAALGAADPGALTIALFFQAARVVVGRRSG